MKKLTLHSISEFHNNKNIALIGLSSKGKQFSNTMFEDMKRNEYKVFPVNPKMTEYEGDKVYSSVMELPDNVRSALVMTPKTETFNVIEKCIEKGIKNIWIQQGAHVKEIKKLDLPDDVNLVNNQCFYMFMEPVKGPHAFHRFIKRLFGAYPK